MPSGVTSDGVTSVKSDVTSVKTSIKTSGVTCVKRLMRGAS